MHKRVLFVIPYMHEGGSQRALSNIQMNFPDDWEIETLVNSEINRKFDFKGRIHTLGINGEPRTESVLFQIRAFVKRINKLRELKKYGEYDACISFSDSANVANIITGNKYCKTIISVMTSLSEVKRIPNYRFIVNPLAKFFYNKADNVVAVSEELKREFNTSYGVDDTKLRTITTGYDIETISRRKNESIDESIAQRIIGKKVICNVGRLSFPKGQWHLIRAFSRVKETIPDSILIIAGDGELKQYLTSLTHELGLDDSVILLGHTDNVYNYVNVADVFAFPSLLEGFPNALAEAICVGTPCVAADFRTGVRELLAPELLFKNERIDSLRECEYGMLFPLCSDTMYTGVEPLDSSEEMLAEAIVIMMKPDKAMKYQEKYSEKRPLLDIRFTVNKWIELISG